MTRWTFGDWTLRAERNPATGSVNVTAQRVGPRGSVHGRYLLTADGDVITVSMASVKVNEHVRTAKVRRLLLAVQAEA